VAVGALIGSKVVALLTVVASNHTVHTDTNQKRA
jgi:hypothetical protein